VAQYVARAMKEDNDAILLRFSEFGPFREKLSYLSSELTPVRTQVAPAGDTTQYYPDGVTLRDPSTPLSSQLQDDHKIRVSQIMAPKLCTQGGAQIDDLLEISYIGTIGSNFRWIGH
jgi:hypothetical protein